MIFRLLRNLKIGLIQLSRELKIADKNKAVDSILRLPRRGSDFLKLCADTRSSDKLKGLGEQPASLSIISVLSAGKTLRMAALRENDGNILIILHPLLATLDTNASENDIENALAPYANQFLKTLESPEQIDALYSNNWDNGSISGLKSKSPSLPFWELNIKKIYPLHYVIKSITDNISEINLKKDFSFIIDPSVNEFGQFIDSSRVAYVLAEIMEVSFLLSPDGASNVRIRSEAGYLSIALTDRGKKFEQIHTLRLALLSEMLSLLGVHLKRRLDPDGHFMIGASIPLEEQPYRLREPELEHLTASYLVYALSFYGLLSDDE